MNNKLILKKTKDQKKDEKIILKEIEEFEKDFEKCRTFVDKIENGFELVEPNYRTRFNPCYTQGMCEENFCALLTDMKYPLNDVEKHIAFLWTDKDEEGMACYCDLRSSVVMKYVSLCKDYRDKELIDFKLVIAEEEMKWVHVYFTMPTESASKIPSTNFNEIVKLSSSGTYLKYLIKLRIKGICAYYIHLFMQENRVQTSMKGSDTLVKFGIVGGNYENPQEVILHYDFHIDRDFSTPLIDNIRYIKVLPKVSNIKVKRSRSKDTVSFDTFTTSSEAV